MNWGEFKQAVIQKTRFADDVHIDTDDTTFGTSEFDQWCLRTFNRALRESFWLYSVRSQLTMSGLSPGDYTLDTSKPAVSDRLFFAIHYMEYNAAPVEKQTMAEVSMSLHQNTTNGQFTAFALDHMGEVFLNRRVSATEISEDSLYVSGWHEHPTLADEDTIIEVGDSVIDEVACYVAAKLIQPTVSTESGYRQLGQLMSDAQKFFSKARHRASTTIIGKSF